MLPKDLSFLTKLHQLENLQETGEVGRTKVIPDTQLSNIAYLTQLKVLKLLSEPEDWNILNTLTNLSYLQVQTATTEVLGAFQHFNTLKVLSFHRLNAIPKPTRLLSPKILKVYQYLDIGKIPKFFPEVETLIVAECASKKLFIDNLSFKI